MGIAGRWSATLKRRVEADTGERLISVSFSQVTPGDIFPDLAVSEGSASIDTPLYGSAEFVLGGDGIESASGRLDLGAGVFSIGDGDESILLDEATFRAHWDVAGGAIVVEPSSIHLGETGGSFTGLVRDEGAGRYAFAFESRDTILAPRDSGEEPLATDLIELTGSADLPVEHAQSRPHHHPDAPGLLCRGRQARVHRRDAVLRPGGRIDADVDRDVEADVAPVSCPRRPALGAGQHPGRPHRLGAVRRCGAGGGPLPSRAPGSGGRSRSGSTSSSRT